MVTVLNPKNVLIDKKCIFGIGSNSTVSSEYLSLLVWGINFCIVGKQLRQLAISIPTNFQFAHNIFYQAKTSGTLVKNEGADEFFQFATTDQDMDLWICTPYTEPNKHLKEKLLQFGFLEKSNDQPINGLIGLNYLTYLKMVKEPNEEFQLQDG